MQLVTYNIQYGRGKDEQFDLNRVASEITGADVIALQEVERNWQRSGFADQPSELAAALEGYYWVYGPGVDLDASGVYPKESPGNRRRQFGNMLLAKKPILAARNHLLPKYASLGPMSLQRSALEGVIATNIGPVRFYSVHLTHLAAETRLPQIDALLELHRSAPWEGAALSGDRVPEEWTQDGMPDPLPRSAIFMGDFNATPDSLEYQRLVGPMSVYGGRIVNPEGMVDAWVASGHDETEGVTAEIYGQPVRLDYCFVSTALRDRIKSARIDVQAQGSDHQPVWTEIDL